jgi:hypothetical protein
MKINQLKKTKEPRNIKEFLPNNLQDIRKNNPLNHNQNPENQQRIFIPAIEPIKLFPEWPSEEEIMVNFIT